MKKRKIIFGAVFAAFIMLATTTLIPVTAQEMINPPKEIDEDLIIKPDTTNPSLTDITNNLASSTETLTGALTANDEINTLLESIQNNRQVQYLIEQIQNTEDEKQKQALAEQLLELIESLPEYQQLQDLIGTEFETEINNMDHDLQQLLAYIDMMAGDADAASTTDSQNSLETSTSNYYLDDMIMMIPPGYMMEYHYVYYPEEDTEIPNPNNPEETLTWEELITLLNSGETTIEDLTDYGVSPEDIAEWLIVGGILLVYQYQVTFPVGGICLTIADILGDNTCFSGDLWWNLGIGIIGLGTIVALIGAGSATLGLIILFLSGNLDDTNK